MVNITMSVLRFKEKLCNKNILQHKITRKINLWCVFLSGHKYMRSAFLCWIQTTKLERDVLEKYNLNCLVIPSVHL